MAGLPQGIYEALLDEELNAILRRHPELRSVFGKLDPEEEPRRYAAFLARLLEKALRLENDPETRLRLCNKIAELITGNSATQFLHGGSLIKTDTPILLEITPPNYAHGGMPRPETGLVESSLFTGSPADPQLVQELGREMRSADSVDRTLLKEIVCSLFSVIAPNFVIGFAEEYYTQHSKIFADYDYDKYQREAHNLVSGLLASYPARLNPREREAFAKLHDEDQQTAFRIAESLSKYEDEAEFPPPLFHLSCNELGLRLGVMDTPAQRILRGFEASGIIEMVKLGTIRKAGARGVATTWRWKLNDV